MTMYLKYEVREVREKALSRCSDVDPWFRSVNSLEFLVPLRFSSKHLYLCGGGAALTTNECAA